MKTIKKCGIDIVRGCQLKCLGCPNSMLDRKIYYITKHNFGTIIRNIDAKKIDILRLFNFGEPMLHPELVDLIRMIPLAKFETKHIELSTNAQYLNTSDIWRIIKDGIVTRIVVSCDGNGTPDDYERMRPPAKWHKLSEFLSFVGCAKRQCGSKIQLVTRTICSNPASKSRWETFLKPMGWKPEFRGRLEFPGSVMYRRPKKIPKGICTFVDKSKGYRLYSDIDGTVIPCCWHPRAFVMGNLIQNRYSEILQSSQYKAAVKALKKRREVPVCMDCEKS